MDSVGVIMIESSPFTDNIVHINLTKDLYIRIKRRMREETYNREQTYGFVLDSFETKSVSAYLVITTPTKVQSFDPSSKKVEEQVIDRTKLVPFRVDQKFQFLEVFSNKKDTQKVITHLDKIVRQDFIVEEYFIPLDELYKFLTSQKWKIKIKSVRINNFSLNKHTNGNCYLKVFEESEAKRLLDKYTDDVTYLGLDFVINENHIAVGFYRRGSIRIYSKTEEDEALLQNFKEILVSLKR